MTLVEIELTEITNPGEELVNFLTSEIWEFHSYNVPTKEQIRESISKGYYNSETSKSYWINRSGGERIGFIRLFDLEDSTPLFDIRLLKSQRRCGVGEAALKKLVEMVFNTFDNVTRIEGYTREDNIAMIKLFLKCGFVKEAHHRKSWEQSDGEIFDSVGYCILKEDWLSGNTTPVNW